MKGSRKDLSFVRAAGSGGWHSDLPAPMAARIPCAIRKDQLGFGILTLALRNRCNKILRNRYATDMPMLGMPLEVWLVHDI